MLRSFPLLALHKVGMVEVLEPSARVDPDGLQAAARGRRDPNLLPGRWNAERADTPALRFVGYARAIGIHIPEAALLRSVSSPPALPSALFGGRAQRPR